MTTITIERAVVHRALSALEYHTQQTRPIHNTELAIEELRDALAAPATAPEFPTNWAQMIHYPECWDTAAYPELRNAIHEVLAWSGCSVCKPATAPEQPAWHDAPTCAGVWICDEDDICYTWTAHSIKILDQFDPGEGMRWFGPIPEDKP